MATALTWELVVKALTSAGYEGDTAPGKKAMEDITAFIGPGGTVTTADGTEISDNALTALAELTPQGEGDQIPVTINLGDSLAPAEEEIAPEPEMELMAEDPPAVAVEDEEEEDEDLKVRAASTEPEASKAVHVVVQEQLAAAKAVAVDKAKGRLSMPTPKVTSPMRGRVKNYNRIKHLTPDGRRERAYAFGHFCLGAIFGKQKSMDWLAENGIQVKAQTEGTNSAGGYLVPEEMSSDIIDLREEYGIFRQHSRVVSMASDHQVIPRRAGGLTAYAVGEEDSITESDKSWDQVSLTAKKWATLTRYTSEVDEDAIISIGDDLAGEIAYAFANKEDESGFNGDGTSTYHGVRGVRDKIGSAGNTDAVSGNTTYLTLDLADFNTTMSLLPEYAYSRGNVAWYCSRAFYATAMQRLAYAGGGNTVDTIGGGSGLSFLGYPVHISQSMPSTTAVSQVCVIFGALELATTMGDRRGISVATSTDRYFDTDEVAIRGTTRFDINCHDVGDGTNAGAVVTLTTAAS